MIDTGNVSFFRYQQSVTNVSKLLQARTRHPLDEAISFLEYVADTKGASHMRLRSRHLNFVQYHSLDVIAFGITMLYLSFRIVKFLS